MLIFKVEVEANENQVDYIRHLLMGRIIGFGRPKVWFEGSDEKLVAWAERFEKEHYDVGELPL